MLNKFNFDVHHSSEFAGFDAQPFGQLLVVLSGVGSDKQQYEFAAAGFEQPGVHAGCHAKPMV